AYIAEKPPLAVQLEWDQGTPSRGACRGVELDLIQDADSWRWSVAHGGSYSNGAEHQLSSYLGQLRQWSLAQNQDHGPILVHLELKNTDGAMVLVLRKRPLAKLPQVGAELVF